MRNFKFKAKNSELSLYRSKLKIQNSELSFNPINHSTQTAGQPDKIKTIETNLINIEKTRNME